MPLQSFAEEFGPLGNIRRYGTAAPSVAGDGTFKVGDQVINTVPAGGGATYIGWVCITAGTPGSWKGFGLIQV